MQIDFLLIAFKFKSQIPKRKRSTQVRTDDLIVSRNYFFAIFL